MQIDTVKLKEKFFGNEDFYRAYNYCRERNFNKGRTYFKKAIQTLKQDEFWEAYNQATSYYMQSFMNSENYNEGIEIGERTVEFFTERKDIEERMYYLSNKNYDIGRLYNAGYKPKMALSYFEKALEANNEHYGANIHFTRGLLYLTIGTSHAQMGNLDKGLAYFLKSEQVLLNSTEGQNVIKYNLPLVISNIGIVYFEKGNYEKALDYMTRGLNNFIAAQGTQSSRLQQDYFNISNVYNTLGEYDVAIDYLKKGISSSSATKVNELLYSNDLLVGMYNKLGTNYLAKGNKEEAFEYYTKAKVLIENDTVIKPEILGTNSNLGKIYFEFKEYDKALKQLQKSDSLANTYKQNNQQLETATYEIKYYIAKVLTEKGLYDEARSYLWQSFQEVILGEQTGNNQSAKSNLGIATTFEKEQLLDSALFYTQRALIDMSREFSDYEYSSNPSIQDIKQDKIIFKILELKAKFAQQKAREISSKKEQRVYNKIGIAAIDLADRLHSERVKKQGSLRGSQLKNLLEISLPFYRRGLDVLVIDPGIVEEKERIEKAFYFTQKMKARQLWATQLGSEAKQLGKIPKVVLEKEQQLLSDIQYYEQQVKTAIQNKDSVNLDLYRNTYLFNAKDDYRDLLAEIEKNYPDFFETKFAFNPAKLSEIQENLNENEIILEYTFSEEDYVYLFVIGKEIEPQFLKIPLDAQTDKNISTLTRMLRKSSMERNTSREKFVQLSHALYNQFVEPAKDYISGKKRLIIIGEGKTNYIPFEALVQSDEVKPFSELDYLLTDYEVSYHYSSTLFTKSRKQERVNKQSGIFAFAPVYENGTLSASANPMRSSMASDSTFRAFDTEGNFTPLPESEKEVNAIADLFKKKGVGNLKIALREEANEANLKSNLQQAYQYIHIAGHSFANIKSPKFSGIACYQEEKETKEDGILYAGEIYNLSTKADLFTLSSCESGFGKLEQTEGLLGLNRAFIYAGAPNVTFSLWKIYDKVSAQCMIDFYAEILKDKSYASALRQSKLNLLNKEETASPNFWSPFLLIGR